MKRLLVVTPTLRTGGGVIRSLQNLLALFPTNMYSIDVLPMGYSDCNNIELVNCKVLSYNVFLCALTATYSQTNNYPKRFLLLILKIFLYVLGFLRCRRYIIDKFSKLVAKIYGDYDIVIAFQEGPCTHFTQYINSPYKIAWIHCDYLEYQKIYPICEEHIYSIFDKIVCVSRHTMENFQRLYPMLKEKTIFVYNVLDKANIRKLSKEITGDVSSNNKIQIISIGRINPIKQFHLIPSIIAQMLELGANNFHWILIGDVDDKNEFDKLNTELSKHNISKSYFTYLGPKYNPYPYIKNSDVLVSTSLSEACPFVVNEARVLSVPVVSNRYPSIYELIENEIDGRICSLEEMPGVLSDLILNIDNLMTLKKGMIERDYNNGNIINKVLRLLNKEL